MPGMGGGGSARGSGKSQRGWGARKGESALGETGVGREFPSKKGVPPLTPSPRPPNEKERKSPVGGTQWGQGK